MRSDLIWHDVEQGSPEWRTLRAGKITGTSAAALLVDGKDADGIGAAGWSLIYQIAGEIVTGETDPDFTNYAAARGKDLEPFAIREYEEATFRSANLIGFVQWGDYCGASPDFMVDERRGGETKCLLAPAHLRYCHTRKIEKDHLAQVQWSLFVTGFDVWDLVHFHPGAGAMRLIIDEIRPDEATHETFARKLPILIAKIEEVVEMCREMKYTNADAEREERIAASMEDRISWDRF